MADFNRVGNPQLASGIGRLYGVDFPELGVLGSEIQVTTSPWERPEFWALLGGGLGIGVGISAANAGFASQVQLYNPVGSGVLLILEQLHITNQNAAGGFFTVALQSTQLSGSTGAWVNRDVRRANTTGGAGGLACRIRTENAAAIAIVGSVVSQPIIRTLETLILYLDYVIPPGWGIETFAGPTTGPVANQQMVATFIGRERAAPPAELQQL